jgi:predicted dehydrogenase
MSPQSDPVATLLEQGRYHEALPLVTGADGRAVVELFTAIYRSNREGRPVTLGTGAG